LKNSEQLRLFKKDLFFVKKKRHFDLKVPLFAENSKKKFAHELKKNKFVFN
jgi:hypothetical protein